MKSLSVECATANSDLFFVVVIVSLENSNYVAHVSGQLIITVQF